MSLLFSSFANKIKEKAGKCLGGMVYDGYGKTSADD
jgi:hypothetical protein